MCSTTVLLLACLSADLARMTRWSLERARSCSALAYGSRSTAVATASAPSYTTSGDATCRVGLFDLRPRWNSIAVGVEAKAESFDADVAARGRPGTDVKDQHGETNALLDVAWPRSDRGLFWCDAARSAPHTVAPEAQLYIDVLAPKQLEKRVGRSKRDGMPVSCLGYSSSRRSRGLLTASGSSPGNASLAPR